MKITVRLVKDEVTRDLGDAERLLSPRGSRALVGAAAQVLVEQGRAAFNQPGLRPSTWAPRKDKKTHPLLKKSGTLWQSLTQTVISEKTAVVSSDQLYAAFHQFGTKHMPARPFIPVRPDNQLTERAERLVTAAVQRTAKSIMRGLPG